MPILPAEPEIYPPDLPGGGSFPFGDGRSWWCLHTKPRQEKATARYLRLKGLSHYLPQVVQAGRTPKGRTYRSVLPLFSSYVFLLGDEYERSNVFLGNTLVNVLAIPDQREFASQIGQIYRLLASGLPVRPEEHLPVGARCRILEGPLRGLVGTVIRRGGRDEFVAAVRFLGRGATILLADWQVERVDTDS
jgi:transcription antitermination factor NusG